MRTAAETATHQTTRYGARRADLEALVASWGEPRYRATQIDDGLWSRRRPLEDLTALPKALRARLADALPLALELEAESVGERGRTRKWLWRARSDGAQVETVLMEHRDRATVCVSSQAGCAMGCTFCATGQAGLERHLAADEIVEQVVRAAHASSVRVSNVVYMGMGEPLANLDAVWESVERIHSDLRISARHITISTVGLVPGMRRLVELPLPVTLAVSLHAPDDDLRDALVPVNRRYPVADVLAAARTYAATKGRRVTFEYALVEGVNDAPGRADELARLLRRFPAGAHVNLIVLNPTAGYDRRGPAAARVEVFAERLRDAGVGVTVRRNRGADIDAACGQLRARHRTGYGENRIATDP